MIKLDYSEQEQVLIPEGTYEFIIKNAEVAETKGGTENIYIPLVIRNDVAQEAQNRMVFHRIYRKKEPSPADMEFGGFNAAQLNALCKAVGLPNGSDYESLEEVLFVLTGGVFRAELYHEEFNGKTSEKIKFPKPSNYPASSHAWKKPAVKQNGLNIKGDEDFNKTEIIDEEVPF